MQIPPYQLNYSKRNGAVSLGVVSNPVKSTTSSTFSTENKFFDLPNYAINFCAKSNMPKELRVSPISECNPINEHGVHSEKLSGVLSTALSYVKPDCPLILGRSEREASQRFIANVFGSELFSLSKEINHVIFVEDDRIVDNPIMIVKDEAGKIGVIGDVGICDKETKDSNAIYSSEIYPFDVDRDSILLSFSEIEPISLGEKPIKCDLNFIRKFDIEDVLSEKFGETGNFRLSGSGDNEYEKVQVTKTFNDYPMFSDIGGNKEAIQKIIENIYAPLVFPDIFGHQMTKGSILEGPPGTGKSMLGMALSNELSKKLGEKVSVFSISGAEMQVSAVGGSEAKWRDLFEDAHNNQPSLIIIDELDACTPKRDGSSTARYDNSVVNQILTLMSNLEKSDDKTYIIGMTNRVSAIDPAVLRSGRFGNIIEVPAPNLEETREIFDIVSKKYNLSDDIKLDELMKKFVDIKATGATISGVLENAGKYSYRRCDVYSKLLDGSMSEEEVKSIKITSEDINKALSDEKKKLDKAKINSDRIVIKGFNR